MPRFLASLFAALALLIVGGCGGGGGGSAGSAPAPAVTVTVSPATATVQAGGGTLALTASVGNAADTSVSWQVNGIAGGNASVGTVSAQGVYAAPATVPSPANVSVRAVSNADPTASASAAVTISAPPAVTISLAPPSAGVVAGGTQTFVATVDHAADTSVTWQVNGIAGGNATVGTISTRGVYSAPAAVPSPAVVTVTAIANADTGITAQAAVTITAPAAIAVTVSPATANVLAGAAQAFTASVVNTANTAVTWRVNGIAGGNATVGTINAAGLYTAPAAVPAPATVTISAVSVADATASGSAAVTVTAPPVIAVSVSPTSASLVTGTSQAFTASVTNTANTAVTWQVNGIAGGNATVGTVSASGVYTAPAAVPSPANVTVRAVSAADTTKSASATVTITPAITVSVSPASASVQTGATQAFSATVANTANTAVTWRVNGVAGGNATVGTVSGAGVYTAPAAVPSPAAVTVSAVSSADATKSASATVTVTAAPVIAVSVSPASASVPTGAAQAFSATVTNTANTSVTWQVNGVTGGNATVGTVSAAGLYTAPAAVPPTGSVTVSAVSVADTTKSASATVTVTPVIAVTISVAPRRAALTTGQPQAFSASVTGAADTSVTWAVDGITGGNATVGTISAAGVYTPPATGGTHTVRASANAAPAQQASASVAVTDIDGVLTQRYDAARTAQNLREYALTPTTLATSGAFGKVFSCATDGPAYAQPLYVANLAIGGGTHNVVFVATEHNSVYAFDADAPGCTTYWKRSFLSAGVTTVPAADTGELNDIPNEMGITGTPAIDLARGVLYVVVNTKEAGPTYPYRLHALSLATGAEVANSPVVISASVNGIAFDPQRHLQRPGLLLVGSTLYIVFGSHGDTNTYYGWVMAYDKTSLAQTAVFNTAPHASLSARGGEAAIWMSGAGPAADASGNLYVSTGNGTFTATGNVVPAPDGNNDFGDSVLKLSSTLALRDYFTPSVQSDLNAKDWDVGSGGVVVLPDAAGSTAHPRLAAIGDKESKIFLVDRDAMGRYVAGGPDSIVQTLVVNPPGTGIFTGIFSTPTYWNGRLYIGTVNDKVKAYTLANAAIVTTPSSTSAETYGFPGTNTVVTAAGNAGAVLWALDTSKNGTNGRANGAFVLRAYDATNLATRLWSSDTLAADAGGNAVKFAVPTVANGKVYVAGQATLTVYGLQP